MNKVEFQYQIRIAQEHLQKVTEAIEAASRATSDAVVKDALAQCISEVHYVSKKAANIRQFAGAA